MAIKDLTQDCNACGGTGREVGESPGPGGPVPYDNPCAKCEATGHRSLGHLDQDLIDKLNDMEDKINDIFEKVNE